MKFTALIAACRFPDAKWLSRSGEPAEVRLCLPAHVVNVAAEQTLYIGPLADMPSPKIGACYLITDPNPVNSTDFQHYMGCDVVHTTQCAEDAHWTAAQCLSEEQWLNSAQAKMIELLFSGASLQALIDEAYNIMGNPIVVVDSSYKILAVNDALSSVRPDLARQQELGYMLETNIASMKRDQLYEKARETRYPYYSKDESTGLAWITALVYADSIEVGQIGMVEHFREFTHADFELINFLCRIIGMELQKDDFSYKNSGHMHSILMKDLLDQLISNEDAAAHRAASKNRPERRPTCLHRGLCHRRRVRIHVQRVHGNGAGHHLLGLQQRAFQYRRAHTSDLLPVLGHPRAGVGEVPVPLLEPIY